MRASNSGTWNGFSMWSSAPSRYAVSRLGDERLGPDLDKRTLCRNGVSSVLSAREFERMLSLLERPGTILSREQLKDRLYGWGKEVKSNAVDVLIHSVRKKFAPVGDPQRARAWLDHDAERRVKGVTHASP
jgi:DNA-binding response OmpR family regulator